MGDYIGEVLSVYGLKNAKATLLWHNENRTYRIDCKEQSFCLRLKTPVTGFDLSTFGGEQKILLRYEAKLIYI